MLVGRALGNNFGLKRARECHARSLAETTLVLTRLQSRRYANVVLAKRDGADSDRVQIVSYTNGRAELTGLSLWSVKNDGTVQTSWPRDSIGAFDPHH